MQTALSLALVRWSAQGGTARGGEQHWAGVWLEMCTLLVISIFHSPLELGLFVERIPHDPVWMVAAPFGVAGSRLTMEKTTPSLPAMCLCSQKYFYSNIHLFTT